MRIMLAPFSVAALALAAPAVATGGYLCKTADGSDVEIAIGFGHVPGAPVVAKQLKVKGRIVPVEMPQWWIDASEMRIVMTDSDMMTRLLTLRAKPNGRSLDGTIDWDGKTRWVRCYEN